MMKSPPAEIESPAKAFPAGDPMSGWSYESNVMMPTPMSNAAATMLSNASQKKNVLTDDTYNACSSIRLRIYDINRSEALNIMRHIFQLILNTRQNGFITVL